jgi:ketosteroid isomerase-like protein
MALEAAVTGDADVIDTVFTDDVVGWSPNLFVTSRDELAAELADRDEALSNVVFSLDALDVIGNKAIAEWRVEADHTGPLHLDDLVVEPTGRRLTLAGASFAEFRGEQICAFRHYFDDAALIEQMILAD